MTLHDTFQPKKTLGRLCRKKVEFYVTTLYLHVHSRRPNSKTVDSNSPTPSASLHNSPSSTAPLQQEQPLSNSPSALHRSNSPSVINRQMWDGVACISICSPALPVSSDKCDPLVSLCPGTAASVAVVSLLEWRVSTTRCR